MSNNPTPDNSMTESGLAERLREHAEAQIEDNLDYIRKADELMLEAAAARAALSRSAL